MLWSITPGCTLHHTLICVGYMSHLFALEFCDHICCQYLVHVTHANLLAYYYTRVHFLLYTCSYFNTLAYIRTLIRTPYIPTTRNECFIDCNISHFNLACHILYTSSVLSHTNYQINYHTNSHTIYGNQK